MKARRAIPSLVLIWALAANSAATVALPDVSVSLDPDAGDVVITWFSEPLNPGSATEIYYGFQLEQSGDLASWSNRGEAIAARLGGGRSEHEVRVPLAAAESFFRLRLVLDLAGEDLSGGDLSGLDLGGADLSGADLSGTLLAGAKLDGVRLDSIGGAPGGRVAAAIPYFPYDASVTTFDPGSFRSLDTLLVFPDPDATVAEINELIATLGGTIVGGFGGDPDRGEEGMLVVHFPGLAPGSLPAIQQAFDDSPAVANAFEDALLHTDALPDLTGAHPQWDSWGGSTREGNWGLRLCRFPQAWNFNEAVDERITSRGESQRLTRVGVIDDGFDTTHKELALRLGSSLGMNVMNHGTHVAGIIAAAHNGIGMDGASPWVDLHLIGSNVFWPAGSPLFGTKAVGEMFSDLVTWLSKREKVKVVNISMGRPWRRRGIDPTNDLDAQDTIIYAGLKLNNIASRADAPIIINSAGNDGYLAKWNSSVSYAALVLDHPHIFSVEALAGRPTGEESIVTQWPGASYGSNYEGNISAPGAEVLSCVAGGGYRLYSGTSMAAPHVTGLVAFLYSLQPDLSKDEVMELIRGAAQPVDGASPRIDAFAAVMDIDKKRGGEHLLRALVDIDDRTEDGNQRIEMLAKTDPTADPLAFDIVPFEDDDYAMIGDGVVDMSDFRRFRDWNLLVKDEEGLIIASDSLDGPPTHPKHDPNRNRRTYNEDRYDRFYPRTDFNGDGLRYEPDRSVPVAGVFNGTPQNDLEVFQRLFEDPDTNYKRSDLPGLVASSDLHISLYWFMEWNKAGRDDTDIHQVRVRIESRIARTERVYFIDVPGGDPDRGSHFLITLPAPDQHRVFVCGDVGGAVGELGENALVDFDDKFGRDLWFAPRVLYDGEPCEPQEG